MWPFRTFKRSAEDIATIKVLEHENMKLRATVDLLEAYKRKQERLRLKQQARIQARKPFRQFIGYKSYRGVDRQFWPKTLCGECVNKLTVPNTRQIKCELHKMRVGKFSSCQFAEPKRIALKGRVA